MATTESNNRPDQRFRDEEQLFRRVFRQNVLPNGKATLMAFELPDMSVNREKYSTAAETRRGFRLEDWGVVSILVGDMPPRESIPQQEHSYRFRARHVPAAGNFAHSEVRVWREASCELLITERRTSDFRPDDPDLNCPRAGLDMLDPDFHMRWRKRLALRCRPGLRPEEGVV